MKEVSELRVSYHWWGVHEQAVACLAPSRIFKTHAAAVTAANEDVAVCFNSNDLPSLHFSKTGEAEWTAVATDHTIYRIYRIQLEG